MTLCVDTTGVGGLAGAELSLYWVPILMVAPEPDRNLVGAGSVAALDVVLTTLRALGATLLRCVGLASVMSPPEPCEEQPTSNARKARDVGNRNRCTFIIQFIFQRKYKGLIALA
jgi:hypothetical protein